MISYPERGKKRKNKSQNKKNIYIYISGEISMYVTFAWNWVLYLSVLGMVDSVMFLMYCE
jgi:hypothetical protein